MRTKINELICQISGVETEPFRRYVGKINVNEQDAITEKIDKLLGYE